MCSSHTATDPCPYLGCSEKSSALMSYTQQPGCILLGNRWSIWERRRVRCIYHKSLRWSEVNLSDINVDKVILIIRDFMSFWSSHRILLIYLNLAQGDESLINSSVSDSLDFIRVWVPNSAYVGSQMTQKYATRSLWPQLICRLLCPSSIQAKIVDAVQKHILWRSPDGAQLGIV